MKHVFRLVIFAGMSSYALLSASGAAAQIVPKCETLLEKKISAEQIGLPTKGAVITRARMVTPAVAAAGAETHPYCLVSGEIAAVDPTAPNIDFQVALPRNWNSKALMLGGGGFDGVIPPVAQAYPLSPANVPTLSPPNAQTPVALGYAVFGSDGGHENETPPSTASVFDAAFFGNQEAYRNYIGDALKKTHDVAIAVIEAAYGHRPTRSYFRGSSRGGGEAIMAVARWPADWDGAVAWFPARDTVMTALAMLHITQSLAAPGAYLNVPKRGVLYRAAIEACDALDGIRDGIISDEKGCRARFDPATASLNDVPLRCPDGRDTGDTCLSDSQIAALKNIEAPVTFGFMPGGARTFPGFNILTADLGASEESPYRPFIVATTLGTTPPSFPAAEGNLVDGEFSDRFFRFAFANDKAFNQLSVNLADPGPLVPRIQAFARLDQVDDDLTSYANRGGKLIIIHGTGDLLISPRATEQYYDGLRSRMGGGTVDRFLRFYEIPGFSHGASTIFNARLDDLAVLEAWVERNEDPAQKQVVVDAGHAGRTRPLCLYPNWQKYKGSGDANSASSFVCAQR